MAGTAWHEVRSRIEAGDPRAVAAFVRTLDRDGRRSVAAELPGYRRARTAGADRGVLDAKAAAPLLVAGAGCIAGAAAAAAWLCRTDLRMWRPDETIGALVSEASRDRAPGWRADVARRIAERLRPADGLWTGAQLWYIAAALTRDRGLAPPDTDGFVMGWVRWTPPERLGGDPFLDALLPRLFEAGGAGRWLTTPEDGDGLRPAWTTELAALARDGRIERTVLLHGCLVRFTLRGNAGEQRRFVRLHDALEPSLEESAYRVIGYVHLLADAHPEVARAALREVRRVDDAERLDGDVFTHAVMGLLSRREKDLLHSTLDWLDRTPQQPDRVAGSLRALSALFRSDDPDLRERAVKTAVRLARDASEGFRAAVRKAAGDLPPALRDRITAEYGEPGDG